MTDRGLAMNNDAMKVIERIVGIPCSRKEVGRMRSLSLGFGQEVKSALKLNEKDYREWEIGTYRSAWRVTQRATILCGSQDVVDSIDELTVALAQVDLGRFASLRQVSDFDIRIDFDSGVAVDFLAAASDDDEYFHVFCPGGQYIELSARGGWKTGPTNKPWADPGVAGDLTP